MELLTDIALEQFAQAVVRHGTATAAFREVFDPERKLPNTTAWERASRIHARPDVSRRVDELRHAALSASQVSVVTLIHDLVDIARANPNELCRSVIANCRYCHGEGHAYQWASPEEYAAKCDEVHADNELRKEQSKTGRVKLNPLPTCEGGFGFAVRNDPNPMCPQCMGAGTLHVIIPDTTQLSPQALKLYKGIRVKADGSVEVLMHDQLAARDQLHRLVGAYKDSLAIPNAPPPETGKTAGDVHKTYLALIKGGKAA